MSFSKEIKAGPATVTVSEANGVASLKVSMDQALGGGAAAGVLKEKVEAEVDLGAEQAADLACALIEAKLPQLASFIEATIKPAIHAELGAV